jgi:hypothetical protein
VDEEDAKDAEEEEDVARGSEGIEAESVPEEERELLIASIDGSGDCLDRIAEDDTGATGPAGS